MASSQRDEISRLELLHAAHPDGLVFPHLADAYRRAGRYTQAESLLNAGLRRHAEYSSAHVVLGRLRLDQGKRQEAETAFHRVLQLDPQNQVALEYLAEIAAGQGRLQEALSLFRRLTRLKTDDALTTRVDALERQLATTAAGGTNGHGRPRPAPANGGAVNAREEHATGREDRATTEVARPPVTPPPARPTPEEAVVKASAEVPESAPEPGEVVTETMAELYARQGLHHRAAAVYRQLLERAPDDARLRAKLAGVEGAIQAQVASLAGRPGPARTPAPPAPPPRTAPPSFRAETRSPPPVPRFAQDLTIGAELRSLLAWTPGRDAGYAMPPAPPAPSAAAAPSSTAPRVPVAPAAVAPIAPSPPATDRPLTSAPVHAPAPMVVAEATAAHQSSLPGTTVQTRSLLALTDMLVGLLEYRDPFFRGSSSLTRLLATSVAEEMGLSTEDQVDLALAAVLRDLGRLALGGKLLATGKVDPSQEARRKIERHVDLALHLMDGIELPKAVRTAVRHHHERWDGAGYPDALAAERIPPLARILAVVDSFAAMVSPRPYRLPRKVPEAAAELQQEAGTRYDPEVVNALVRVLARREQPHLGFVQRHHVLVVNPDQPGAVVSAAKLCSAGYLAEVAVDPATARERLKRVPVAALVVSAESGADEAASLIRELRVDPLFSALPIVVVDAATVALRVRLLESGADVCFPPGVRHAELQGTLGALVRRTLRPRPGDGESLGQPAEAPWLALQGDVQDFPLTWLLQVMKYDSRTAAVGIRTATREGVIYLRTGDAVHAQIRGGASGEAALREMMQWGKGRFTVQPDAQPKERTITTSLMHLLLSQAVDEDHAAAGIFGAVSEGG